MLKNKDSRVLCRQLARDLTPEEMDTTSGGIPITVPFPNPDPTTTFCTVLPHRDGDDD